LFTLPIAIRTEKGAQQPLIQAYMKKTLLILFILLVSMISSAQQDPQFSQYMFNLAGINPGSVGSTDKICLSGMNRQQWVGFPGAPSASQFNVNTPINPFGLNSGIGFSILSDNLGFNNDLGLSAAYAYRLDIGSGVLGIGVNLGLFNKALNAEWYIPSELSGSVQPDSDPLIPQKDESQIAFDMGFGLYYSTDNLYFGISANHLNQAKIKYETSTPYLARHYYAVAGYRYQLSNPLFEILPSAIIKSDGRTNSFDVSTLVRYNKKFWGGVSYRAGDAVTGIIGVELFNGIRVGYSYDFNTSSIGNYSKGSHEFSLGYCFSLSLDKTPQKYRSIRFL
jgi:type IX secretion system PorP/SprF family membrane protein